MAATAPKFRLDLDPSMDLPATRDAGNKSQSLPQQKETKSHLGTTTGGENALFYFIGNATTILEWEGMRLMTDPNFLHTGDHVRLGPGVTGTRVTNPAVDLEDLPRVDVVLLSHYHADHFDGEVEASLRRDIPIISTPHAYRHLSTKPNGGQFTQVLPLDPFEMGLLPIVTPGNNNKKPCIKVTAMPGKHVPPGPGHVLERVNELVEAVPPTDGWMVELGHEKTKGEVECEYRIYVSGDTIMVDELKAIPERYKGKQIDLMLIHLGGTTLPGPHMPLLVVTMDDKQGVELIRLINPKLTIPIHFDDYDVFLSPLEDFKTEVDAAGLADKVVYLDRGDAFKFAVKIKSEPESK